MAPLVPPEFTFENKGVYTLGKGVGKPISMIMFTGF
jgi:hypothetical protein